MASASATISPAAVPTAAIVGPSRSSKTKRATRVKYINGLNSFGGLKAHTNVVSLGLPLSTDQSFANMVTSLKKPSHGGGGGGGGALTSTCNAVDEIFTIAAILPALVLVGVAVGFVLLRIEAAVEEE